MNNYIYIGDQKIKPEPNYKLIYLANVMLPLILARPVRLVDVIVRVRGVAGLTV